MVIWGHHLTLKSSNYAVASLGRISKPSCGLTFHHGIQSAVAACERLVLVVGPKAALSDGRLRRHNSPALRPIPANAGAGLVKHQDDALYCHKERRSVPWVCPKCRLPVQTVGKFIICPECLYLVQPAASAGHAGLGTNLRTAAYSIPSRLRRPAFVDRFRRSISGRSRPLNRWYPGPLAEE